MKEAQTEPLPNTEPNQERIQGTIIYLDPTGYGFIVSKAIPFYRIFFFWSSLNPKVHFNTLRKGMTVEFVAKHYGEDKGYRAIHIELVD